MELRLLRLGRKSTDPFSHPASFMFKMSLRPGIVHTCNHSSLRQGSQVWEHPRLYREILFQNVLPPQPKQCFSPKVSYVHAQRKSVNSICSYSQHKIRQTNKQTTKPQTFWHLAFEAWCFESVLRGGKTSCSALLGDSWPWEKLIILKGNKTLLRELGGKYLVIRKSLWVS